MKNKRLEQLKNKFTLKENNSNRKLKAALQTIIDEFGINFGQVTFKVHAGRASEKLSIETVLKTEVKA